MSEIKRCFIAINLPEALRKEIFERLSEKIPAKECKAVKKENLHLTMLFFGDRTAQEIAIAKEKMLALKEFKKFYCELSGIGEFNERVFWLGTSKGEKELQEIARKLQELFAVKGEKFSAHLTIARNKSLQKSSVADLLKKLNSENFSSEFEVKTIELMESVLSPLGPEYSVLFSIALK